MAKTKSFYEKKIQKQFRYYPSMIQKIELFTGDGRDYKSVSEYIEKAVLEQLRKDCLKAEIEPWRKEFIHNKAFK